MTTNNSINFANVTTKSTPTTSDLIPISDQAASGALKLSPYSGFPAPTTLITTDNFSTVGSFCASLPGTFSETQSDTQTQSPGQFNTRFWIVPFYVGIPWTATKIQTIVKTGVAASTITMAIYASVSISGEPTGAPLTQGSVATTTSNTLVTATISTSLSAYTLYWAAIQASTATTLALSLGLINVGAPNVLTQVGSLGIWLMNSFSYTNTYSAGALPTINPANAVGNSINYMPIMRIQ